MLQSGPDTLRVLLYLLLEACAADLLLEGWSAANTKKQLEKTVVHRRRPVQSMGLLVRGSRSEG